MNVEYRYNYDKLWHKLIDLKMKKKDLMQRAGLTTNVIAKMGKGEAVPLKALARICSTLACGIADVVEFIPAHVAKKKGGEDGEDRP